MSKISRALGRFLEDAKRSDSYWIEATKLQFAMSLEVRRKAANLSYKALADKLGVSGAYITKVFRGDSNLTIESMVKIARATGGQLVVNIADQTAAPATWDAAMAKSAGITLPSVLVTDAVNDSTFAFAA